MPYHAILNRTERWLSERDNRAIAEITRAIIYSRKEISQKLWTKMVNTAACILNRSRSHSVPEKSCNEIS